MWEVEYTDEFGEWWDILNEAEQDAIAFTEGRPLRTFYTFNPSRTAILLIGGDKTGNDRFYDIMVPLADRIYDAYLKEIQEKNNG
jgi:hypothetical protein